MQKPDEKYIEKIKNINFKPVFILGLHRSGTSILYKILVSTAYFNPVTAYDIIEYEKLLSNHINNKERVEKDILTNLIRSNGQKDRGIDKLKITADFPEEYGFILGKYSSKYFITKKNVKYFERLAKKIQFIKDNDKPILLKNPWDFGNFIEIKKLIPNARFIFIHRNAFNTLSSFLKAAKSIFKKKNFYTSLLYKNYEITYENPLLLFITRFLFSNYHPFGGMYLTKIDSKSSKYYINNIDKLPKKDYIELTYEDLCKNPNKNISKILGFLDLESKNTDFSSFIKKRKTNLDPIIRFLKKYIYKSMKKYFEKFGYDKNL